MGESWEKLKKWSKNEKWYRKSVFKMPMLYALPLVLAYWNFQSYDDGTFSDFLFNYIIFFLITGGILYSMKRSILKGEFRDRTERKIFRVLDKLLETHIDTLAAKRSKYIHKDPFGKEVRDDWVEKGIMYFIDTQLRPRFSFYEQDRLEVEMDQIIDVIDEAVRSRNRRPRVVIDFSRMNAVKEMISGKQFHNTPFGAIITSRSFTDAAKKLAAGHGIFLLQHKSIARLEGMGRRKFKCYYKSHIQDIKNKKLWSF